MEDFRFISVLSSKESLLLKLSEKGFSPVPEVFTLMQMGLREDGEIIVNVDSQEELDELYSLTQDVCFLKIPTNINEDNTHNLLSSLGVKEAPILFVYYEDTEFLDEEDDDYSKEPEDVFTFLENQINEESLALDSGDLTNREVIRSIDYIHRIESLVEGRKKDDDPDDLPILLNRHNRLLDSMIPEDSQVATILVFPVRNGEDGELRFSSDLEFCLSSRVAKCSHNDTSGRLSVNPNGTMLVLDSCEIAYYIESMTPGVVTVLAPSINPKEKTKVLSWIIHEDQLDGTTVKFTEDIIGKLSNLGEGVLSTDNLVAVDTQSIQGDVFSLMGSPLKKGESVEFLGKAQGDLWGEED